MAGSVAERALAALKGDNDDSSGDDGGLSHYHPSPESRPTFAPRSAIRASSPSRARRNDSWEADLKQKMLNFQRLNSPHGRSPGRSPGRSLASATNNSRSPSNSIASTQKSGRVLATNNNVAISSRMASPFNNTTVGRTRPPTHQISAPTLPAKSAIRSPQRDAISITNNGIRQRTASEKVEGIAPSGHNEMIDLTGNDSEDSIGVKINETLHEHFAGLPPKRQRLNEKEDTVIAHKENIQSKNKDTGYFGNEKHQGEKPSSTEDSPLGVTQLMMTMTEREGLSAGNSSTNDSRTLTIENDGHNQPMTMPPGNNGAFSADPPFNEKLCWKERNCVPKTSDMFGNESNRDKTQPMSHINQGVNGENSPMPMPPARGEDEVAHAELNNVIRGSEVSRSISQNTFELGNTARKESPSVMARKKSGTTSKKSSSTKKGPNRKPPASLSCSLTGTLYCSVSDGHRCHVIRGLWEYENQAESSPQRFMLCRNISPNTESIPLTTGGIFEGCFVYQWEPNSNAKADLVFKESEVNICFDELDSALQSFTLTGRGQNEVGKFELTGTARKKSTREYRVEMWKKYSELFPSRVPPPILGDVENMLATSGHKRKFSRMDSSAGSSEVSSDHDERQPSSESTNMARAISMSTEISNTTRESENNGVNKEMAGINNTASGDSVLASTGLGHKSFLDQPVPGLARGAHQASANAEDEYDPVSMLLSPSDYFPRAQTYGDSTLNGWQEFGLLQGMDTSIVAHPLSWNVRNVKPKYSQMNLDFFDSVGIVNVQDLLEADESSLCSHLLAFDEFKVACAFNSWKRKLNSRQDSRSSTKGFHELYRPDCAKMSILSWKEAAKNWYKKIASKESIGRQRGDGMHVVEAAREIDEAVSEESEVQGEIRTVDDRAKMVGRNSEVTSDSVLLKDIMDFNEADALERYCHVSTAQQLLSADRCDVVRELARLIGRGKRFAHRNEREVECIVEGMLLSWLSKAQEAVRKSSPAFPLGGDLGDIFPIRTQMDGCAALRTPLGYADLQFIKSQHISSDEQLAKSDPLVLAHSYVAFLGNSRKQVPLGVARELTKKWQQEARLALGTSSREVICESFLQSTRLDKDSGRCGAMLLDPNLCKTVTDEENGGLPRRIIFTYDRSNYVLYEFEVCVKDSLCSLDAGKGAFLTYQGAKVLKSSSKWKRKRQRDIPFLPQTRKPLEALFPTSGATVHLTGANLHGDEHHYGPEEEDRVGVYREFTLDDFVDASDNVSFSSKHLDCALIELDRYAPLLPVDRKTELAFMIKDFIFSHEPSSWRFNVTEELNGHRQVVDFTSDTTGAPHDVAQSHMSMYVNEVGHNMDLVENVLCLETSRSVSYYIHIDRPMVKGDTTELLVNYRDHYETMRERRGYGKANLLDGVQGDSHDITRVRRNLRDRFSTEENIIKLTEDEIREVIEFMKIRVWDGVIAATSTLTNKDGNLLRQCIARRRMHWLSMILKKRFYELCRRGSTLSDSFLDNSDSEECIFQEGILVFVNDWPKNDPRPPYTGLATIMTVSKDKYDRNVFEVSLSDGKCIEAVPEAVVTFPTDDDFKDAPKRIHSNWVKWKKEQDLPRTRKKMLKGLHSLEWDPSFANNVAAQGWIGSSSDIHMSSSVFQSLRWEISEELLFLLVKEKRLSHPFDGEHWCPLSVSLLTKCLHLVSYYLLMDGDQQTLCESLMGFAHEYANSMKKIASGGASNGELAFLKKSCSDRRENLQVLVAEAVHVNRLTIEDYLKHPQPLDLDWYLTHQLVLAIHPVASLINWDRSTDSGKPLYSVEKLCDDIGLNDEPASYLAFYLAKIQEWRPLL